jgi:hypothetical protein
MSFLMKRLILINIRRSKKMKKICVASALLMCVLFVTACGKESSKTNNNQSAVTTSKTSNAKATASKFSVTRKRTSNHKKVAMNFEEIKAGNYSSLLGDWKVIKSIARRQDMTDSTQANLLITKNRITDGDITMDASGLTEQKGHHLLTYQKENGALRVNLADEDHVAINYEVTFYPAGTANEYTDGSKNVIIIWTSNDSSTTVFEQEDSNTDSKTSSDSDKKNGALWNTSKDEELEAFINRWSKTMDQDYQKYDGVHELEASVGISYPSGLAGKTVNDQPASVGWSKDGNGSYEYNVVAIYNHDGDLPPLPNRITYCFAFHNGEPVVLVDQSRDGPGGFGITENAALKAGFNRIAEK